MYHAHALTLSRRKDVYVHWNNVGRNKKKRVDKIGQNKTNANLNRYIYIHISE